MSEVLYVFIIFYRDGSRKTIMGATYRHTNDVVRVIRYRSSASM